MHMVAHIADRTAPVVYDQTWIVTVEKDGVPLQVEGETDTIWVLTCRKGAFWDVLDAKNIDYNDPSIAVDRVMTKEVRLP